MQGLGVFRLGFGRQGVGFRGSGFGVERLAA